LDPNISLESIKVLVENGLTTRFADLCTQAKRKRQALEGDIQALENAERSRSDKELTEGYERLGHILLFEILKRLNSLLPSVFPSLACVIKINS